MSIYQVVFNQTWQGQQVRNVLYYDATPDVVPVADFEAFADNVRAEFAAIATNYVSVWSIDSITFRRVDLAGFPGFEVFFALGPLAGTGTGDSVATQIALLVSGRVFNTTPPNRTRTYVAGMMETQTTSAGLFSLGQLNIQEALYTDLDAFSGPTVTWDRLSVQLDPLTGVVTASNSGLAYQGIGVPATQRRRRIGVGI